MKLFPLILFFLVLVFGGWFLAHRGPDVWLHPVAVTATPADIPVDTSLTNTVSTSAPTFSTLPPPTGIQIISTTVDQISIRWDPVDGASSYRLYRDGKLLGLFFSTTFTDLRLTSTTSYSYSVASVDALSLASVASTPISATTSSQLAVLPSVPATVPSTKPTTPTKTTSPKTGSLTNSTTPASTPPTTTTVTPSPNTTTPPPPTTVTTPPPVLTTTPPPTTSTPPPPIASCGSGGSCTAIDVAAHGSRGNCWVYLTTVKKVYNITAYVANGSTHPGGDVIVTYCGKDITGPFTSTAGGGKKHSSTALNSVLQAYYIGAYQ